MGGQKHFRCAIYTRKSHEEGLDQEFNSLDAQREACSAYIASQAGLGWTLSPTLYDDGGISGGHMQRPALQALIGDIQHGLVDIIVVYKVDRLTRSLTDFAKLVDVFDAHQVSFVSVTQAFNTTNSMGRLTLNVLLSFAQFEREVTAERSRDKIAASKKKGMWMGGLPPLGYTNVEKRLVVVEKEAIIVRKLFALYAKFKNVRRVWQEADRLGLKTKQRNDKHGHRTGGKPFSRGHLYVILNNPLYVGKIVHKKNIYEGQHEAIVDQALWDEVHSSLQTNAIHRKNRNNARSPSLLAGLIHAEDGQALSPSHANKASKRYRYYVSKDLKAGDAKTGWRIPALMIEGVVRNALIQTFHEQQALLILIAPLDLDANSLPMLFAQGCELASSIEAASSKAAARLYHDLIQSITISKTSLKITLNSGFVGRYLAVALNPDQTLMLDVPIQIKRRGHELKMVVGNDQKKSNVDPKLIRLVAQAYDLKSALAEGHVTSIDEYAAKQHLDHGDARRLVPLGYLAPDIVEMIIEGRQPVDLTVTRLRRSNQLPMLWPEQRSFLGCSQDHQIH